MQALEFVDRAFLASFLDESGVEAEAGSFREHRRLKFLEVFHRFVHLHGGELISVIGPSGLMAVFSADSTAAAINAWIQACEHLAKLGSFHCRGAVCWGRAAKPLIELQQYFGLVVDRACWLARTAKSDALVVDGQAECATNWTRVHSVIGSAHGWAPSQYRGGPTELHYPDGEPCQVFDVRWTTVEAIAHRSKISTAGKMPQVNPLTGQRARICARIAQEIAGYCPRSSMNRLLADAELDSAQIDLGGSPADAWFNIVLFADRCDRLRELVAVVVIEYSGNSNFRARLDSLLGMIAAPTGEQTGENDHV